MAVGEFFAVLALVCASAAVVVALVRRGPLSAMIIFHAMAGIFVVFAAGVGRAVPQGWIRATTEFVFMAGALYMLVAAFQELRRFREDRPH